MDQLKDFLRQCVKYRFWIAFGVSLILPIIGYFVGAGAMKDATTKREAEIKGAKGEVAKYTTPGIVNKQYQPIAAQKKEELTKDVSATWRKLFALQEPLLKWPEDVEERFRKWGRKFPTDVDKGQVHATIIDYTISYPNFVSKIYKTFKPFDFESPDGGGIVAAPDERTLLRPAPFSADAPPELGKVWAEQERLWVVTALLDVVAKVNQSVGAKDWDGAIVKQLNLVEVGSQSDQDQVSMVKSESLVPSDPLYPDGVAPPTAATTTTAAPGETAGPGGVRGMMMPGMSGGSQGPTDEVYYIKTEGQQYKSLPIKMIVLVDQSRLPDFLVGLENSPMAIQVKEVEIAKPLAPVVKPVYGDRSSMGMGMGMGMGGYPGSTPGGGESGGYSGMARGMAGRAGMVPGMTPGMPPGMSPGGGMPGAFPGGRPYGGEGSSYRGMMPGGGGGGTAAVAKQGTSQRSVNKQAERKQLKEKEAGTTKDQGKNRVEQYLNVIEVTVYGQARFFLAPPPEPESAPSTAATTADAAKPEATKPEAPKVDESTKPTPAPKAEEPKIEAPQPENPKAVTPAPGAPAGDAPAPKR